MIKEIAMTEIEKKTFDQYVDKGNELEQRLGAVTFHYMSQQSQFATAIYQNGQLIQKEIVRSLLKNGFSENDFQNTSVTDDGKIVVTIPDIPVEKKD